MTMHGGKDITEFVDDIINNNIVLTDNGFWVDYDLLSISDKNAFCSLLMEISHELDCLYEDKESTFSALVSMLKNPTVNNMHSFAETCQENIHAYYKEYIQGVINQRLEDWDEESLASIAHRPRRIIKNGVSVWSCSPIRVTHSVADMRA
jgi:hypothetical protein